MAEYRTIRMSFWADPFVEELEAGAKLLYLYLFTGPHTNNLGIVEVTRRKIAFETGLSPADVEAHLKTLVDAGKIVCDAGQILLCNFIRNQTTTSPKIIASLSKMIPSVQSVVFREALSIRYPMLFADGRAHAIPHAYPMDTVSVPYAQGMDTVGIPSPEREEEREREIEENTASASPAAEPAPTSSPDGGGESAQERAQAMPKAVKTTGKAARAASAPPDEPHYQAKSGRYLTGKRLQAFERFWRAFAFAKGKAEAADAWLDIPLLTDALVEHICHAAQCEARERAVIEAKGGAPKWAQGWLNARRWEDYPPPGAQARTGVGTGTGAGTATGIVPAYELPELTPEQQEAARQRRAEIVRERAQRREVVPMREAQA